MYYTETEVDTISGALSAEIDADITTHASNADAHHTESHTVASHSDTSATGAELDELTDGSTTVLHDHDGTYYTQAEVNTISGALSAEIDSDITTHAAIASAHHAKYTDEEAQDAVGNIMSGAGTVTVTYDDAGNTITVSGSGGGGGETNTASNLGAGEGVYGSKSGVDLRFKSLVGAGNVTLSSDSNQITISGSDSGSGGASGAVLQSVYKNMATKTSSNARIIDSTTPTSSTGAALDNLSITLVSGTSTVRIQAGIVGDAYTNGTGLIAVLSQSTTVLATQVTVVGSHPNRGFLYFDVYHTPGAAGTYNYAIRVGSTDYSTVYYNRTLGDTTAYGNTWHTGSWLTLTEIGA
jgi:hypothetical protein